MNRFRQSMFKYGLVVAALWVAQFSVSMPVESLAQEKSATPAADQVDAVAKRLQKRQQYKLEYKLAQGEEIRWVVEHVVSTRVQMAGEAQESSSRSSTEKVWTVKNVDRLGNMTFVLSLESIDMWQKIGEEEPVAYNSAKDKEIPEDYQDTAEKLGKPLAVFSIMPDGTILDRRSALNKDSFGVGKVTIPLPKDAVAIGHTWTVPTTLRATDENGTQRRLNARILYQLMEVRGHQASIKFKTEVLTPIKSEKVRSQIMQKMTEGYVVFDMERGRPVVKRVEWDEKAQGFEGPDSLLTYVGKMTEKLAVKKSGSTSSKGLKPVRSNAKTSGDSKIERTANRPVRIKTRDDQPLTRK